MKKKIPHDYETNIFPAMLKISNINEYQNKIISNMYLNAFYIFYLYYMYRYLPWSIVIYELV